MQVRRGALRRGPNVLDGDEHEVQKLAPSSEEVKGAEKRIRCPPRTRVRAASKEVYHGRAAIPPIFSQGGCP